MTKALTPQQQIAKAMSGVEVWVGHTDEAGDDDGNYGTVDSDGRRDLAQHALDAVREALISDDPKIVRAMAERIGLTDLDGGHQLMDWVVPGWPTEEIPDADERTDV